MSVSVCGVISSSAISLTFLSEQLSEKKYSNPALMYVLVTNLFVGLSW